MNLYSIILGIILLMGLCYIYSSNIEGFREGQAQEGSDVFVKADIGIVVSGAGLGAVNGKYAAGVGPGRIAAYCKKENKEQYCDKSKPWYFNVKIWKFGGVQKIDGFWVQRIRIIKRHHM